MQGVLTLGAIIDPQAEAAFLALLASGPVTPELATFDVESFCKREMARYSKSRPATA